MPLAPWRSPLARALHRNRALVYARYLQLATVRSDGRPANRTVVFRGFWGETNQLQFVTDARSEKAAQIESSIAGELCWYFPKTREQFRIAGTLTLVRHSSSDLNLLQARQSAWQALSEGARSQFTWPDPGKPRATQAEFELSPPATDIPLPQFCLLLLDPNWVDHLELRGEPQNRWQYQRQDGNWSMQPVNP